VDPGDGNVSKKEDTAMGQTNRFPTKEAPEKFENKDGYGLYYYESGWHCLEIESANPFGTGTLHGYFIGDYIKRSIEEAKRLIYIQTGFGWDLFKQNAVKMWKDKLGENISEEIRGIEAGVKLKTKSSDTTFDDILTWNGYEELTDYWLPTAVSELYGDGRPCVATYGADDRCSAFIANGDYTVDGRIVVAHNSFSPFEVGRYLNVIARIKNSSGNSFAMQTQPGYVHSMSDFYTTSANLVVTETTIGGFCVYDKTGIPEFVRIRNAVQFANNTDEFIEIMRKGNNGGYANTWLIGDYNKNTITRFEQGLKFDKFDTTGNGYFAGFNAPLDPRIRNLECSNSGFADIRRHQGARQIRIPQLMERYKGEIDDEIAKTIISDHFDVYNECETEGNSRTVCSHYELDKREYMSQPGRPLPYQPRGAVDGIVSSAKHAEKMELVARFGSSCGKPFIADDFLKAHPQFEHLKEFLVDRPTEPWITF